MAGTNAKGLSNPRHGKNRTNRALKVARREKCGWLLHFRQCRTDWTREKKEIKNPLSGNLTGGFHFVVLTIRLASLVG